MNNEFVTYDQALKLKELGFDMKSFGYYTEGDKDWIHVDAGVRNSACEVGLICAPLKQQAFKWFRETHNIKVISIGGDFDKKFSYLIQLKNNTQIFGEKYESYEEAEDSCINKLFEI